MNIKFTLEQLEQQLKIKKIQLLNENVSLERMYLDCYQPAIDYGEVVRQSHIRQRKHAINHYMTKIAELELQIETFGE